MFKEQIEMLEYKEMEIDASIENMELEIKEVKKERTLVRAGLKRMIGLQEQLNEE